MAYAPSVVTAASYVFPIGLFIPRQKRYVHHSCETHGVKEDAQPTSPYGVSCTICGNNTSCGGVLRSRDESSHLSMVITPAGIGMLPVRKVVGGGIFRR
jgi:hypothetical protein